MKYVCYTGDSYKISELNTHTHTLIYGALAGLSSLRNQV